VPNLITDRGFWVARFGLGGNVRRLMYQSLIWPGMQGDDPRRLRSALDSQDVQGLADALVDGVRGDPELRRNLLRAQMLVDEAQAIELPRRETRDALGNGVCHVARRRASTARRQIV
jgi:hypothetical protein